MKPQSLAEDIGARQHGTGREKQNEKEASCPSPYPQVGGSFVCGFLTPSQPRGTDLEMGAQQS